MEQTTPTPPPANDYVLSLFEACEILGKSSRTVSRYVHKRILHPMGIKSRQGTLEYRFSKVEVEALKKQEDELRQITFFKALNPEDCTSSPGLAATFATVDYQQPPFVRQQVPFPIPGISYPTATATPVPPTDDGKQPNVPPEPVIAEPEKPVTPVIKTEVKNETPEINEIPESEKITAPEPSILLDNIIPDKITQGQTEKEMITFLKETTDMLRDQLRVKDDQIKNLDEKIGQLIERSRETNILLKGLQDKIVLLGKPKSEQENRNSVDQSLPIRQNSHQSPIPATKADDNPPSPIRVKIAHDAELNNPPEKQAKRDFNNQEGKFKKEASSEWIEKPETAKEQKNNSFFKKIFG